MNGLIEDALPDATIVIAQHRHVELTGNCLAGLRTHDPIIWPVIVVDDGSPVEDFDGWDFDDRPGVKLIRQSRAGVSIAWNRGAAEAGTGYLIFLNNDVVTSGPWVDRLLEPLRAGRCLMSGVSTRVERALPNALLKELPQREFLEGWCFAVSRDAWRGVSGFDESLRVYWSDTDFQLRLRSVAGRERRQLFQSVERLPLRHLGHRTAHDQECLVDRRKVWEEDRMRFIEKWTRIRSSD